MNDPDPEKRAQWEAIPHEGEIPTPEEWLYYAVNYLIELGIEICCGGIRICEWAALEGCSFWGKWVENMGMRSGYAHLLMWYSLFSYPF